MADVSSSNGGRSLRCPINTFFFPTVFKDGNRIGNCGCENSFRLLGTERTQTPTTICGGSTRTRNDDRRRPDVFKHTFVKDRCAKRQPKYVLKFNSTEKNVKCHFKPENSVTHQMIAEVSKRAAALREACAAEPTYQTADGLWKGLERNDLAAQLVLTFAQRLRFNKRTRHSLQAAKRQEDKRWVRILRREGWNLYLLMRQRAVPNRKKQGNTTGYLTQTERRTKVRLGQADAAADTVDEQAAAAFKATWSLVLSSCCVLWKENWYRAQYTTHPDESDRSQNCTAMAVLQLKQRPAYWAGHPAFEDLAARITTVARALQQRERRIPETLRDLGYADRCAPDTGNVRAPLDVRRDARTVQAPVWRPFALSKEKVTGGVGLFNLLHFAKDNKQTEFYRCWLTKTYTTGY